MEQTRAAVIDPTWSDDKIGYLWLFTPAQMQHKRRKYSSKFIKIAMEALGVKSNRDLDRSQYRAIEYMDFGRHPLLNANGEVGFKATSGGYISEKKVLKMEKTAIESYPDPENMSLIVIQEFVKTFIFTKKKVAHVTYVNGTFLIFLEKTKKAIMTVKVPE